jgi:hypothetical protein|uniref:Uncharacterized protein n=1 Tax=viral metagenome TaxID=1070528 RepID=A0A6C0KB91_9ZZZZ
MVKTTQDNRTFRINWFSFIFAFILGSIYVYISSPPIRNIIKYPTPYNANKIVYRDHNQSCYKFNAEEVKCTETSLTQPII